MSFLSEYPIILWAGIFLVAVLVLNARLTKRNGHTRKPVSSTQRRSSLSHIVARRSDAATAAEAVRLAVMRNQRADPTYYVPLEIEGIAMSGVGIEIPFGKADSVLWAAKTHGAGFFEDLAKIAETIGRADMSAVILQGADIARRALGPDAEDENPILLDADAKEIAQKIADLGGVEGFIAHLNAYLEHHYPWQV